MLDQKTLSEIKKLAFQIDHNLAFGGKSKGNKHLFRVVKVAEFLAKKTGADLAITTAGALLHDTALPSGNDYIYKQNKKIVRELLQPLNLSQQEVDAIAECVASHEGTEAPKSLEAQVVHDADVLEKVGMLGIIRHTWKMTNQNKLNSEDVQDKDVEAILDHLGWRQKQLQTTVAKTIADYLTISIEKTKAKELVAIIAGLAFQGTVTEKIALVLEDHLTQKQKEKLREQLDLSYLHLFD